MLNSIDLIEKHLNPSLRVSTMPELRYMTRATLNLANQVADERRSASIFPSRC